MHHLSDLFQKHLESLVDVRRAKLLDVLTELSELPATSVYAPVLLAARRLTQSVSKEPWSERLSALQAALRGEAAKIITWTSHSGGCNLLAHALSVPEVQLKALETLIRRSYRAFGVSKDSKIHLERREDTMEAKWKFRHPGQDLIHSSIYSFTIRLFYD